MVRRVGAQMSEDVGQVVVRRMEPAEAQPVAALIEALIMSLAFYDRRARAAECALYTAEYLIEAQRADPDAVLVAERARAIVGFCVSRYDDDLIWLSWFGKRLGETGKGIGAALLADLHRRRRAAGVHKIWCDSRSDNHASRACLARAGYREICLLTDHWFRQDYVLLERRLDD